MVNMHSDLEAPRWIICWDYRQLSEKSIGQSDKREIRNHTQRCSHNEDRGKFRSLPRSRF